MRHVTHFALPCAIVAFSYGLLTVEKEWSDFLAISLAVFAGMLAEMRPKR